MIDPNDAQTTIVACAPDDLRLGIVYLVDYGGQVFPAKITDIKSFGVIGPENNETPGRTAFVWDMERNTARIVPIVGRNCGVFYRGGST